MKILLIVLLSKCVFGRSFDNDKAITGTELKPDDEIGAKKKINNFESGNDVDVDFAINNVDDIDNNNNNQNKQTTKEPISILFEEPFQLPEDEEWPEVNNYKKDNNNNKITTK